MTFFKPKTTTQEEIADRYSEMNHKVLREKEQRDEFDKEAGVWKEVYRINGYGSKSEVMKKAKVQGGWIYKFEKSYEFRGGASSGTKELMSICFVPGENRDVVGEYL